MPLSRKLYSDARESTIRGKADCGDIDILITRSTHDGKTHHGKSALRPSQYQTDVSIAGVSTLR